MSVVITMFCTEQDYCDIIQLSDDFEFDIGIYFVETCDIDREAAGLEFDMTCRDKIYSNIKREGIL